MFEAVSLSPQHHVPQKEPVLRLAPTRTLAGLIGREAISAAIVSAIESELNGRKLRWRESIDDDAILAEMRADLATVVGRILDHADRVGLAVPCVHAVHKDMPDGDTIHAHCPDCFGTRWIGA